MWKHGYFSEQYVGSVVSSPATRHRAATRYFRNFTRSPRAPVSGSFYTNLMAASNGR